MGARAWTLAAIGVAAGVVLALGCAGKGQMVSDGGGGRASSSGGVSSGVDASHGGSSGSSDGNATGASESGSGSSSGSSSGGGSGSDCGAGGTFDGDIPDAFPANCQQLRPIVLVPDAAPHTCAFTPADVVCNTNADCTAYVLSGCGGCGIAPAYGVNTANTIVCPVPPCPPPPYPPMACPDGASGYRTQDCQLAAQWQDVAFACVNHQCFTYAAPGRCQ